MCEACLHEFIGRHLAELRVALGLGRKKPREFAVFDRRRPAKALDGTLLAAQVEDKGAVLLCAEGLAVQQTDAGLAIHDTSVTGPLMEGKRYRLSYREGVFQGIKKLPALREKPDAGR